MRPIAFDGRERESESERERESESWNKGEAKTLFTHGRTHAILRVRVFLSPS